MAKNLPKIVTVVGTRPEFDKMPLLLKSFGKIAKSILVHTGQHYDDNMDKVFFDELKIPKPKYTLSIGSAPQGEQTGKILEKIEKIFLQEKPDLVVVYGDTNSTLGGALAAAKLNIPIAHIEAGMRSYNRQMPEEINRVITDHISDFLFCSTRAAVDNLKKEGIWKNVSDVGDLTVDILKDLKPRLLNPKALKAYNLKPKTYLLATVHRAENTDKKENLENIVRAFGEIEQTIIFPVHPRTKKYLKLYKLDKLIAKTPHIRLVEPVGYFDMMALLVGANLLLTDSGGLQKEAYLCRVPCVTLRKETEWFETVKSGWNHLAGSDLRKIVKLAKNFPKPQNHPDFLGNGKAYLKITEIIKKMI